MDFDLVGETSSKKHAEVCRALVRLYAMGHQELPPLLEEEGQQCPTRHPRTQPTAVCVRGFGLDGQWVWPNTSARVYKQWWKTNSTSG